MLGHEHSATLADCRVDDISEPLLTNVSGLVGLDTICGLNDTYVKGRFP